MFELTVKPNIVGKPDSTQHSLSLSLQTGPYEVWKFDGFDDLRQYAYIEGRAYTHGVMDVERHADDLGRGEALSKTPRSYDYFLYADVLSVDIDKPTTVEHTLDFLLERTWTENVGLIYPSSSYREEAPRWHLVYKLSERIYDRREFTALAAAFYAQITLNPDERLTSAVQLTYGTVFRDSAISGKPLGMTYVNDDVVLDVDWLRSLPEYSEPKVVSISMSDADFVAGVDEYRKSAGSSLRTQAHRKQSQEMRELVVIDALSALLPTFSGGVDYNLWVQMWMSAYDGAPTKKVFDYIANHPAIEWSDGETGKAKFYYQWTSHQPKEDGYQVASLFWLAEKRGKWLRYSPYDVHNDQWELINVSRITDWTEQELALPKRVVLHSQTGLGKSMNVVYMLKTLDNPKAVLFVPTRKLAMELTTTLRHNGIEATLYFHPSSQQIKPTEELRGARVLVTTLQTFSTKVYSADIMKQYDLVYVEESDQLLAQFSLAGGVTYSSHITKKQAARGYQVLADACKQSGHIWFVDATMTSVTVEAVRALCPPDQQPRTVRNIYKKPKAPVTFLHNRGDAFDIAVKSLLNRKRIVIACDTKATATEFYDLFKNLGLEINNNIILITKDTESDPAVIRFMEDVNTEAPKYNAVIYNSVMVSGVSITSIMPDVLIQVAEYLPPRVILQLLNRYRRQKEVYCHYQSSYRVYGKQHQQLMEDTRLRVLTEQGIMGLPIKERSDLAVLRGYISTIAEADYHYQNRSAIDFYTRLLEEDGRDVRFIGNIYLLDGIEEILEDLKEIRKAKKDEIRHTWNTVRPIHHNFPADPGMDLLTIAKGMEHNTIYESLNHYIPDGVTPERLYDIVHRFGPKTIPLTFFANQASALAQAEGFFSDPDTPETAIHANTTSLALLAVVVKLWGDDLENEYSGEELSEQIGVDFLNRMDALKDVYNVLATRAGEDYSSVITKYATTESRVRAFSRILLRSVGLKLGTVGRKRGESGRVYVWGVVNTQDAKDFLVWRSHHIDPYFSPDFSGAVMEVELQRRDMAMSAFSTLNEADKNLVLARWDGDNTTFPAAVKSVAGVWG